MMIEIVENFKRHLQQLGYSKGSVSSLPMHVKSFLGHRQKTSHSNEVHNISPSEIQNFYHWLHERPLKHGDGGLSEVYIYKHVYALKLFFSYLETTGQITINPINALKFKLPKLNSREPLTKEEVKQLFETARNYKETAILHLFYSCGLRRSEASSLNIRDIHFKSGLLYVREGKGRKRRVIPLTQTVSNDLKNYFLQERTSSISALADTEAFILNRYGHRMSCKAFNKFMRTFSLKTNLNRTVSPHYLRHSIATHLLENGLQVEYVREFLGHSYLESTQIYTKINKKQIQNL